MGTKKIIEVDCDECQEIIGHYMECSRAHAVKAAVDKYGAMRYKGKIYCGPGCRHVVMRREIKTSG